MAFGKKGHFYIQLGRWLYVLSGVALAPLGGEFSKVHTFYIWFSFLTSALACILALKCLTGLIVFNAVRLVVLNIVELYISNFIIVVVLYSSRRNFSNLFHSLVNLHAFFVLNFGRYHRILKSLLSFAFLLVVVCDNYVNNSLLLDMFMSSRGLPPSRILVYTASVLLCPSNFLYWSVNYNLNTKMFMLMELTNYVLHQITKKILSPCIATVLPVVDGCCVIDLHSQTSTLSSEMSSSATSPVLPYRKEFKIYLLVKRLHLVMNKVYFLHITSMVLFTACYFPVPFTSAETDDLSLAAKVIEFTTSNLTICCYLIAMFSPFFIGLWLQYSSSYGEVRITKEVYSTANQQNRKCLRRFLSSFQDSYPSTPLVFFDFDSSVWSSTIETGTLIAITVLTP